MVIDCSYGKGMNVITCSLDVAADVQVRKNESAKTLRLL